MKTKIAAIAGIVGITAAALLSAGSAEAFTTRNRTTAGNTPWTDTAITGGGTLKASLILNGSGATSDITTATSGVYRNRLKTTCPDGTIQDNTVNQTGTVFGDITHLCFFGLNQPTRADAWIDDL